MKCFYIVVNLESLDFLKDENGKPLVFDSLEDAFDTCRIYRFDNATILKSIES